MLLIIMQKRIYWLDAAKFIGILLVISDHMAISGVNRVIVTSFHMPLFFWLSGYSFKKTNSLKNIFIKGIQSQIVPYMAGGMISIITYCYLRKWIFVDWLKIIENTGDISEIFSPMFRTWDGWSLYWFLPCLFTSHIFFWGLLHLIKDKSAIYSLLLVIVFNFGGVFSYLSYFRINSALVSLLFMYAGYMCSNKLIIISRKQTILCALLWIIIYLFFIERNVSINMGQHSYPYYPICIFVALGCIHTFIFLVRKIPYNKIISFFGRNTLIIYMVHSIEHNFFPWKQIKELVAKKFTVIQFISDILLTAIRIVGILFISFCTIKIIEMIKENYLKCESTEQI